MKLLSGKYPVVVGMIKSLSEKGIFEEVERIRQDGADAYGFQLEGVHEGSKTPEAIERILSFMSDKPIYFTNYMRRNSTPGITWERLEREITFAAQRGASLIDIPGDMYSSSDMELTYDNLAIEKQIRLIERLHTMGADVLMSSHVLRFVDSDTVLSIALEHERRGADVSKIVINTDTRDELGDAFIASVKLSKMIKAGTLLLCNGEEARTHRYLGPLFGSALLLATENGISGRQDQPTIEEAKKIVEFVSRSCGGFFK